MTGITQGGDRLGEHVAKSKSVEFKDMRATISVMARCGVSGEQEGKHRQE